MPSFLPVFPLSIVVYPGEKLNLHIFENRYKELIRDCVEKNTTFGIIPFINNRLAEFGTEVKLLNIEKTYPQGEMDIRTEGIQVFRMLEFLKDIPDKKYSGAVINHIQNIVDKNGLVRSKLLEYLNKLYESLNISVEAIENPSDINSFEIAHQVGFNLQEEYEILTFARETDRQKVILNHFKNVLPDIKQKEKIKARIKMNGHFRHEIPPEI